MAKNEPDGDNGASGSGIAKFSGIAFQMIAVIGAFSYAGYRIDLSAQHSTKWVTAILALVGVFIALYIVIRSISNH